MKPRNTSQIIRVILVLVVLVGFSFLIKAATVSAAAGVYRAINFQGKIVNKSDGTNITTNSYSFTFRIYDSASGGNQLPTGTPWSETQTLPVTNGIFQATLGSVTPLPSTIDFNSDSLYLDITFNGETFGSRVRLTAVPYALNAEKVGGLTVTNTTGTLTIPDGKTIQFGDAFTTSGAYPLTLTTTGSTTATLPSGTITLVDQTSTQTLSGKTIDTTAAGLIFSGGTTDITTVSNQDFTIVPNGTGNVGIGTTAPSAKLDINGSASISGTLTIANSYGIQSAYGPLTLNYKSGLNAWLPAVTVQDTTGNVGIGTTAPTAKLEVNGAIKATQILTPYAQTITVAKSGADYTTITAALNAITDAGSSKRYLIRVMPGSYNERVTMKDYVDLKGSGIDVTTVTNDIWAASYSTVSDLTISISGAVSWKAGYDAFSGQVANPTYIKNAKIYMNSSTGPIYPLLTKTGSFMYADNITFDVTAAPNNGGDFYLITNNAGGGVYNNLTATMTLSAGSATYDNVGIVNSFWSGTPSITNSNITITNNATSNNTADSLLMAQSANTFLLQNTNITYTGTNKSAYLVNSVSSSTVTMQNTVVAMTAGASGGFLNGFNTTGPSTIEKSKFTFVKNNAGTAYGINTSNSSTKIANSEFYVTDNGAGGNAYGIYVSGASPNIHNNIVTATGGSSASAYGIWMQTATCNPSLTNNTLSGTTTGLTVGTGCNPTLSFNRYNSITNNGTVTGISGDTSGNLSLTGTVNSTGTGTNYFLGNVAIGTTSPLGKLYLTDQGQAALGKALAILDQWENQPIFSASSSGVTKFIIDKNGNVGIGTAAPVNKFTLNSPYSLSANTEMQITTLGNQNTGLVIQGSAGQEASLQAWQNSVGNTIGYFNGLGQLVLNTPSATEPSYSNPGGTGNRIGQISVSTNMSGTHGSITKLIDGDTSGSDYWIDGPADITGKYFWFDFGSASRITEAKFYQPVTWSQGTWQWQGSNNNSDWTDIGTSFTLGTATVQTQTAISGNLSSYRYYRLNGISGTANFSVYITEFEFKIGSFGSTQSSMFSGNNVGIGTTAPISKLQLTDQGGTATGKALAILDQWENQPIFSASSSGVPKLVIDQNGNLGIGTTAPQAQIQLVGNAPGMNFDSVSSTADWASGYFKFRRARGSAGSPANVLNNDSLGVLTTEAYYNGAWRAGPAEISMAVDGDPSGTKVPGRIAFATINRSGVWGTRMTIAHDGNVGIGTTGPLALLDVAGTASVSGALTLGNGSALQSAFGPLTLNYKSGLNSWLPALTVQDSTGYVGIGTAIPTSRLEIAGDLTLATGAGIRPKADATNALMFQKADGTPIMTIDTTNGRVGIGTTQPPYGLFDLYQSGGPTDFAAYNYSDTAWHADRFRFYRARGTGSNPALLQSGDTLGSINPLAWASAGSWVDAAGINFIAESNGNSNGTPTKITFSTEDSNYNHAERMVISADGKVGIGTTAPASRLHVSDQGSVATGKAMVTLDQWENQPIFVASSSGTTRFMIDYLGNTGIVGALSVLGQVRVGGYTDDPTSIGTGSMYYNTNTNKFRCFINTAWADCDTTAGSPAWSGIQAPGADLTLAMSTYKTTFNWATGTGTNNLFNLTTDASANGTGTLLNVQTGSSSTVNPLRVRAGSVEALSVNSLGYVGVGTASAGFPMAIHDTTGSGGTLLKLDTASTGLTGGYLELTAGPRTVRFGADQMIGPHFGSTDKAGFMFLDDNSIGPMIALSPTTELVGLGSATYRYNGIFGTTLDLKTNALIGSTSTIDVRGNYAGVGELASGGIISTSTDDNLNLVPSSYNGADGKKLTLGYYNGASWYSGLELANITGGGTNRGDLLLMKSGGNVGIGTTDPAYILDVAGSSTNLVNLGDQLYVNSQQGYVGVGGVPDTGFHLRRPTGWNQFYMTNDGSSNTQNQFWFATGYSGSANWAGIGQYSSDGGLRLTGGDDLNSPGIFLSDANNIGIGTTVPTTKLDVVGDASVSGNLTIGQNGSLRSQYGPLQLAYKSDLNAWTTGLTMQDGSGNVGIGTAAPEQKLHVDGKLMLQETGYSAKTTLEALSYGYENGWLRVTAGGTSGVIMEVRDNYDWSFKVGYTNGLSQFKNNLSVGGNVGIGTTDAALEKLSVGGNATVSGNLTLGNGSSLQSAYGPLTLNYKSDLNTWMPGLTLQDTTGYVGIGTTNPLARLDLGTINQLNQHGINLNISADADGKNTYGIYNTVNAGAGSVDTNNRKAYGIYNSLSLDTAYGGNGFISSVYGNYTDVNDTSSGVGYIFGNYFDASNYTGSTGITGSYINMNIKAGSTLGYVSANQTLLSMANNTNTQNYAYTAAGNYTATGTGSWTAFGNLANTGYQDAVAQTLYGYYGDVIAGPGDSVYHVYALDWNDASYQGTQYALYSNLGHTPSGTTWSVYAPDTGHAGANGNSAFFGDNLYVGQSTPVLGLTAGGDDLYVLGDIANAGNSYIGGSVGIGTTNPLAKLDVAGDASVSGNLTIGQNGSLRSQYGPLQLAYKSGLDTWTTGLTLQDGTGNVGIGTANPSQKFWVNGSGVVTAEDCVNGTGLGLKRSDQSSIFWLGICGGMFQIQGSLNLSSGLYAAGNLQRSGSSGETFTITSQSGGGAIVQGVATTSTTLLAKGVNSQTANIFEAQDNNSKVLMAVSPVGNATVSGNLTAGGQLQIGRFAVEPAGLGTGSIYYNTTSNKFRCFINSAWADCDTTGGGSPVWSAIQAPGADLSVAMSTWKTTFNWATGTSTNNLFNLTTDASANGTGYLMNLATGTSATVKPLHVAAGSAEALMVDATGNVGVGTTNPLEKLAVTGNIIASNSAQRVYITAQSGNILGPEFRLNSTDTNGKEWRLGSSASDNSIPAGGFYIFDATWSYMRMVIDTNGQVGLSTNTPTERLDVRGNATVSGNISLGYQGQLKLGWSNSDPSGTNGSMYYNSNTNKFRCFINSTWADCDTTAGSPTWSGIQAPGADLSLAMSTYKTTFNWATGTSNNNLFNLTTDNSSNGTGYLFNAATGTSSTVKPLHVAAGAVEAMLIDASGNVGIGSTSPTAKLDVLGNANIQGYATMSASLNVGMPSVKAGFGNVALSGNLGIGTTDPTARIEANGAAPGLRLHDFANVKNLDLVNMGNSGYLSYGNNELFSFDYLGHISFTAAGTENIDFTTNMNTLTIYGGGGGINLAPSSLPDGPSEGDIVVDAGDNNLLKWFDGTYWQTAGNTDIDWNVLSAPTGNLDLAMNSELTTFTWGTGTSANDLFKLTTLASANGTGYLMNLATGNSSTVKPFHVSAGAAEAMAIDAAANVGIGSTSPTQKLDVLGTATVSANLMAGGQLQIGRFGAEPAGLGKGSIYYNTSTNKFRCFINSAWADCDTTGGGSPVWSAIQAPGADLSVAMSTYKTTFNWATGTSTNNLFNLTTDASANGTGYLMNVATGTSATVKPLHVAAGAVEAILVDASGNVGIGSTSPKAKLDVTGTASISGALTMGNGSVIRPAYGPLKLQYKSGLDTWDDAITVQDGTGNVTISKIYSNALNDSSGATKYTSYISNSWGVTGGVAGNTYISYSQYGSAGTSYISAAGAEGGGTGGNVYIATGGGPSSGTGDGGSGGNVTIAKGGAGDYGPPGAGGNLYLAGGGDTAGFYAPGYGGNVYVGSVGAGGGDGNGGSLYVGAYSGNGTPGNIIGYGQIQFGNLITDPTNIIGDGAMYYNSNSDKFRCYINGGWTDCDTTGAGNPVWSTLQASAADLSVAMSTYKTTFNWATGTSTNNLFNLTTNASANGTGYLLNVATGASATVKPFHVAAGAVEAILVDATGNVGIGTTNPAAKLDVLGEATVSGGLTFYGGARTIASRSMNQLTIGDTQTGPVVINNNGNFIISKGAGQNFQVNFTAAPTVSMASISNAGQATTTTGANGLNITYVTAGSGAITNAGINIAVTNSNNIAGTVIYGEQIATISGQLNANETALLIGSGWDKGLDVSSPVAINSTLTATSGTVLGSTTNGFVFDPATGPSYRGTARPNKSVILSPEYTGAVITTYYGAGTDSTNNTGSMTSDVDNSAGGRNFYSWTSTTASPLQSYTVAVRVTLPNDFSDWCAAGTCTNTNALEISFTTSNNSSANNALDTYVYNSSGTLVASSTGQYTNNTWSTLAVSKATIGSNWNTAGGTATIYLRMRAMNSNVIKIGDIKLNYLGSY